MNKLKYLVVGTGRCGTKYTAEVLRSVGVRCGHEGVFELGELEHAKQVLTDELWDAESSWLAVPFLEDSMFDDTTIVHLVRHPARVIPSQLRRHYGFEKGKWYEFRRKHLPTLEHYDEQWIRAAHFYIEWNRKIETCGRPVIFHRIKDDIHELLERLHLDYVGKKLFDDETCNSRSRRRQVAVDLEALPESLRGQMMRIQERYGYADRTIWIRGLRY